MGKGHHLYGGDISGAYYNTPGTGTLILPHNWPEGVGGFRPRERVNLNCAIPGDTLSSGLFLTSLANLFNENGLERVYGATYKSEDDSILLIHFSDDILLSCKPDAVEHVQNIVRKQFDIQFEPVERWVSMEFSLCDDGIEITTVHAARGMSTNAGKFT